MDFKNKSEILSAINSIKLSSNTVISRIRSIDLYLEIKKLNYKQIY